MNRVLTTGLPASNGGVQVPTARPAEQSITASLTVEVMHDLDDGTPTLVASTEGNQGDLQVVTVDQVRAMIAEQRAHLNRQEQLALAYDAATSNAPTGEPRQWTVADRLTGMPLKGTCLPGCHGLHFELNAGIADADDIQCVNFDQANSTELPIATGSAEDQDWATLSIQIQSNPVHPDEAKRIPLAAIEVTEDHFIEDLDPNALAVVIDKLDQRVAAMRIRHAEFTRIHNEHHGRQA
ncbi:DUF6907 domain-containing protein [Streptomyces chartreusis]|uniref:DUF6907 domain-containing protein n=1 Tax=Streptomyces chartreusis TaxID=1969 RepID=UPI0036DDC435